MAKRWMAGLAALGLATMAAAREPILDMHLHAAAATDQGPPPLALCAPLAPMPLWDQTASWDDAWIAYQQHPKCADPIWSPMTDDAVMQRSLAAMRRHNVIGVVGDEPAKVARWRRAAPDRVMVGYSPSPEEIADPKLLEANLIRAKAAGELSVIGEVGAQYQGIAPDSPQLEGLWTVAEKLDLPVALHVGPGPPGTPQFTGSGYRARMSSALLLEDVLARHPRLRLYVMHAGYPLLDDMLALLYGHPQVYVDIGVIVWTQPRPAFYRYLRALVDAGFGDRIMFGTDQMVWPEAIDRAVATIEQAPFLTAAQKRDIFYNNAARFLRLDAATRKRHEAM